MENRNEEGREGIRIERDENSRSDIQREQQAKMGGGYDQNTANMQGQQNQADYGRSGVEGGGQSRGERFDEQQGGGRGEGSVSQQDQGGAAEFQQDQREHQDRGQSDIDNEDDQV